MKNIKKFIDLNSEKIINRLAQDEAGKRQYYRPIYSIHKWWARRPGSLFRSIILLAAANDTNQIFSSIERGALSLKSEYLKSHNLQNTIILDPFMGGGTTLIEANRLGAKVIGCDVNPLSYWIVRESLKSIDLKVFDRYFKKLEKTAGEKIKSLYRTRCDRCGSACESLYVFWLRYVYCSHCENPVYLFKRPLLNKGQHRNKPISPDNPAALFCPKCFFVHTWDGKNNPSCPNCNESFSAAHGTYAQGYYKCESCNNKKISLIHTLQSGQKLKERLLAIEYVCDKCKQRLYKSPDKDDYKNLQRISESFDNLKDNLNFPKQEILLGASSIRWRKHNYKYYHELFSRRQLIAFHYLLKEIEKIPEKEYRYAFLTVFSNSLEYNNMMIPYNYPHRKLHHLFNYHALPLTTTPVENVVWGNGKEGAGTFKNCYLRYFRAKTYCNVPFDKFKNYYGKIETVLSEKETIYANFVSSVDELIKTPKGSLLLNADSSTLSQIPDRTVDFVITDPPYFDNIHYSELSNFFYVWLCLYIKHPYFKQKNVPTKNEAIVNKGMNKDEKKYENLLFSVLNESFRALKDNGKLIFTFHHTKWSAWWAVFNAVTKAGFIVCDYFPVMSEYKASPHIRNKKSLDMDIVFICSKNLEDVFNIELSLSYENILDIAMQRISLEESNITENKIFLHFIGELFKIASMMYVKGKDKQISYEQFIKLLTSLKDFLSEKEKLEYKKSANSNRKLFQISLEEVID